MVAPRFEQCSFQHKESLSVVAAAVVFWTGGREDADPAARRHPSLGYSICPCLTILQ